jgi:NO-binding membrane sensor protein with MHYT domain
MGGVAIWSMHYIGNRAIILYNGEESLQLEYAAGYTVLSFFMPVGVLLSAYATIGAVETPQFWRLLVGGTFGGAAICGMHYLVPITHFAS